MLLCWCMLQLMLMPAAASRSWCWCKQQLILVPAAADAGACCCKPQLMLVQAAADAGASRCRSWCKPQLMLVRAAIVCCSSCCRSWCLLQLMHKLRFMLLRTPAVEMTFTAGNVSSWCHKDHQQHLVSILVLRVACIKCGGGVVCSLTCRCLYRSYLTIKSWAILTL
jgi:hypothetical protein